MYLTKHSTSKLFNEVFSCEFFALQVDLRHFVGKHFRHQDTKIGRAVQGSTFRVEKHLTCYYQRDSVFVVFRVFSPNG
jgi:hypothetical protein